MTTAYNVNVEALNKPPGIIDSLELVAVRKKINRPKKMRFPEKCDFVMKSADDESISSIDEDNVDYIMDGNLDGSSQESDSSIELTRDANILNCKSGGITLENGTPIHFRQFNSTLNDDAHNDNFIGCDEPLISPIEGCSNFQCDARKTCKIFTDFRSSANDKKACSLDNDTSCNNNNCEPEFQVYVQDIDKSDTAVDWLPNTGTTDGDPQWLADAVSNLKPLKPKTYTPSRKLDAQILLKDPVKMLFRTSSPAISKPSPKAKRTLLENLDLSSIIPELEYDSSVELIPRPDTPGTINSDEIAVFSLSDIWNHGSPSPVKVSEEEKIHKIQNLKTLPADPIELLPSPIHMKPIVVKTVKKYRQLYACCDILENF